MQKQNDSSKKQMWIKMYIWIKNVYINNID